MRAYAQQLHSGRPLDGMRALVTGGTAGLGRGIVGHLAISGAALVLPHRRAFSAAELEASVAQSVAEVEKEYGDAAATATAPAAAVGGSRARYDVLGLPEFDLGSFESLERAAHALASANVQVDVLINNAGLVSVSGNATAHGFEATFGVNFIGSAYWTQLRSHVWRQFHRKRLLDRDGRLRGASPARHSSPAARRAACRRDLARCHGAIRLVKDLPERIRA
jgi:NAD(P)-dependent dehydrogenase (short-subunit alcohol dehydrogenase family)